MSIANLLEANEYNLFCNSITSASQNSYFNMYAGNATAVTTALLPATATAINTPTAGFYYNSADFALSSNNKVTYSGAKTQIYNAAINLVCSLTASGSSNITFSLYHNGVQIAQSAIIEVIGSGVLMNLNMNFIEQLQTGDYLQLYANCNNNSVLSVYNAAVTMSCIF